MRYSAIVSAGDVLHRMKIEANETQTIATRIAACGARGTASEPLADMKILRSTVSPLILRPTIPGLSGARSMRVEDIQKVCVLGAGAMGAGIAQVCAQAGYMVAMRDIEQRFVDAGFKRIRGPLMKRVEKGKMTVEEVEEIVARIHGTTDIATAV